MSTRTVEPTKTRFRKELGPGGELLRIPDRRNWFVLLFLPVWLTLWTSGGFMAISEFLRTGESFLAFWLVGWLFGMLYAFVELGHQLAGSETVRIADGDLELSTGFGPLRRTRRYRAGHIQRLRSDTPSSPFGPVMMGNVFWMWGRWGAVKFDYGAKTVAFASAVDEAEGRMIAEWLRPKLPVGATAA